MIEEVDQELLLAWGQIEAAFQAGVHPRDCVAELASLGDACVDSIYVIINFARDYGLPIERFWEMVQSANMRKIIDGRVIRSSSGKILKPPGWTGPTAEQEKLIAALHWSFLE